MKSEKHVAIAKTALTKALREWELNRHHDPANLYELDFYQVEAIAAALAEEFNAGRSLGVQIGYQDGYERGKRDALAKAKKAFDKIIAEAVHEAKENAYDRALASKVVGPSDEDQSNDANKQLDALSKKEIVHSEFSSGYMLGHARCFAWYRSQLTLAPTEPEVKAQVEK